MTHYRLDDNSIMSALLDSSLKLRWYKNLEERWKKNSLMQENKELKTLSLNKVIQKIRHRRKIWWKSAIQLHDPQENWCRTVSGDAIRQEVTMNLNEPRVESTDALSDWKDNIYQCLATLAKRASLIVYLVFVQII